MKRKHFQNLSHLSDGQSAVIQSVTDGGSTSRRIMDLGFTPGTAVKVLFRAPWGDPIVCSVRGYRIGLRQAEAELIHVEFGGIPEC